MKSREISRSKIGPFSLACNDPYIGIGWEYQSKLPGPKCQGAKRPGPKCQRANCPGPKRQGVKHPDQTCQGPKRPVQKSGAKRPGPKRLSPKTLPEPSLDT